MATDNDPFAASAVPCPVCSSQSTETILRLPAVPVHVGLLWTSPESAERCPKGEMVLSLCGHCGYVWNAAFQLTDLDYEQDYDNALHHSPKFAEWETALIAGLVERHDLRNRRLAEIGCGDGRFLSGLCLAGENVGVGFEPGHNPDRVSDLVALADVEIIGEYADVHSLQGHEVDFVAARQVLEHLPEPLMLVEAIRGGIVASGSIYIEVPNFSSTLERGAFEDLVYEHCGYYTPETLAHLLHRGGFSDIEASDTFGGQFAVVEAIASDGAVYDDPIDPRVVEDIRRDAVALGARIERVAEEFAKRRDEGQRLVAWGGGARAVGIMNLVESSDAVDFVVDINPRKQGTFVTGTGHPIVAPEYLRDERPDAILIINPIYTEEISKMLTELGIDADLISI